MATLTIEAHIVSTPGVLGGKPRVAGRRISVAHIAVWHEHMGMSVDEIAAGYDLTLSEIHAALAYYFDNKAAIDQDMRDEEAFVEDLRRRTPSKIPANTVPGDMKFYMDANVDAAVAAALRGRGIDVLTTEEAGMRGASDEVQIAFALEAGGVVRADRGKRHAIAALPCALGGVYGNSLQG